jgi:hypothetical protein
MRPRRGRMPTTLRGMGSLLRLAWKPSSNRTATGSVQLCRRERATADDLIEMLGGKLER